jgi:transcriptional regulator GlxA family with amidase domain
VARAIEFIGQRVSQGETIALKEAAQHACLSQEHFCRVFKTTTGQTLTAYVARLRIEKAKTLLRDRRRRIVDLAFDCGFGSMPSFHRIFKRLVGVSPGAYRRSFFNDNANI